MQVQSGRVSFGKLCRPFLYHSGLIFSHPLRNGERREEPCMVYLRKCLARQ